ncbi:MAG: TRAP transporter substrate-binding protein [Paracoccus sp. (in: a-proteobacteria)]|nr:TRAP transporter substrate-binding protein [Paracoccus sp. (in: a-proteobacteria)]
MMKTIAKGLLLGLLSATPGFGQNVELRMSTWLPPDHGVHDALEVWANSITEASNGEITLTLYPAQQLGRADDHYDMAADGISDFSYLNVGYQAGRFPLAEIAHLPFTVANGIGGTAAFDSWYRPHAENEMSEVKYCFVFMHEPGSLHGHEEYLEPSSINGKRIRSSHATMASFVTLLGGTNVRVAAPESRQALESGVADAVTFPWESTILFGLDNAVHYSMDAPFYVSGFAWVMNPARYDGMSESQKAVIDAHCSTDWAVQVAETWSARDLAGREALREKEGHTLYPLSPEQVANWQEAARPLRQTWIDNATAAGQEDAAGAYAAFEEALRNEGALIE